MAWIRLDDQIAHHPKILKCSSSACWLYVTCISYAQRMLTDGIVADTSVQLLSHVRRPQECLDELVKAGLLERIKDGYQIHDYLDFNESAASVKRRREADRKRKASGRNPHGIHAESGRIPDDPSRARASHPIPSLEEQKISAAASPRKHVNGNGTHGPKDNLRVITKLVHSIMDDAAHPVTFADIKADVKSACSRKRIAYDAEVVGAAIESALAMRVAR